MFNLFWDEFLAKIQEKRIRVAGHNFLQDLMFVSSHFNSKLTNCYEEFKQLIKDSFPALYDTKVISKLYQMETLCLEDLFNELKTQEKLVKVNWKQDMVKKAHDASYDSFMTGAVFLSIQNGHEIKLYENIIKMYNSPFFAIDFNFLNREKSLKQNVVIVNITPMLIDLTEEQIKDKSKEI